MIYLQFVVANIHPFASLKGTYKWILSSYHNLITAVLFGCAIVVWWIIKLLDYKKKMPCIVYSEKTSSFEELLDKERSVTIHKGNLIVLAKDFGWNFLHLPK